MATNGEGVEITADREARGLAIVERLRAALVEWEGWCQEVGLDPYYGTGGDTLSRAVEDVDDDRIRLVSPGGPVST